MKKIEVELNDFCPIDCPYLDIVGGQIWKAGEQEPRPRSYGLKYSCKNMTLCQCVVNKNTRPQNVIVEINGSYDSSKVNKKYLCPNCNFFLMNEVWSNDLKNFLGEYSSSFFYDSKQKRPKFCPRCGKELIYPSDCRIEE